MYSPRDIYKNIHSSTIYSHNSLKLKTTQISICIEQISKLYYIHVVEYYTALRRTGLQKHANRYIDRKKTSSKTNLWCQKSGWWLPSKKGSDKKGAGRGFCGTGHVLFPISIGYMVVFILSMFIKMYIEVLCSFPYACLCISAIYIKIRVLFIFKLVFCFPIEKLS